LLIEQESGACIVTLSTNEQAAYFSWWMHTTAVHKVYPAETLNARELAPVKVAMRGAVAVKSVETVVLGL